MTTKQIEALKKILEICQSDDVMLEQFEEIEEIATQALAPKEQWAETIKCPECGTKQNAIVKNAAPFTIYAHTCEKCDYTITESEWEEVAPQEYDK